MAIDQLQKSLSMQRVEMLIFISTDKYSRISDESVFMVPFKWSKYRNFTSSFWGVYYFTKAALRIFKFG